MLLAPRNIARRLSDGLGWWRRELVALLPGADLSGARAKRLVLIHAADGLTLAIDHRGQRTTLAQSAHDEAVPTTLDRAFDAGGQALKHLPLVLRVDRSVALTRHVVLPTAALADAAAICALDLERGTPFKRADVVVAHDIAPGPALAGKVRLRQSIVKKTTLHPTEALLTRHGLAPDRVECADSETDAGATGAELVALSDIAAGRRRPSVALRLAAAALVLVGAAAAIDVYRLERTAAGIETAIVAARRDHDARRATQVQADDAGRRARSVQDWLSVTMPRAELLDTLTRLLPDTDYLSSLKIDGNVIELSGYSASTAGLVQRLERSGLFRDTTLGADTVFDAGTGKERFSLSTRAAAVPTAAP